MDRSLREIVQRRWQSGRPFAGHTIPSLKRKVACRSVSERAKELARLELRLRGEEIEL